MKSLLIPLCLWLTVVAAGAQPPSELITTESYSGQFKAREIRNRPLWAPTPAATRVPMGGGLAFLVTAPPLSPLTEPGEIRLQAETIGISCERIKQLFLKELALRDGWRGRIELIINPSRSKARGPSLTGIYQEGEWRYELELPKTIQPKTLVQAVVQTLLTEVVNRDAGSQSTDIPYWLVEGLNAHLQAYNLPTFIIRQDMQSAGYQDLRLRGLEDIRAGLRQHPALTFEQLSWPDRSDAVGSGEVVYRSCAELLLDSLLEFGDGRACMQRMLQEMPKHLNWQTAFLIAFHSHFAQLLEVEKWWGLNCVSFTSSDLTGPLTEKECWHKLRAALDVPVEVQLSPATVPARLTLQEVILQWNPKEAKAALERSVADLESLQLFTFRCTMNLDSMGAAKAAQQNVEDLQALQSLIGRALSPLVARYITVLLNYIKQSQHEVAIGTDKRAPVPYSVSLKRETVRQLDLLDQEREAIWSKSPLAREAAEIGALEALQGRGINSRAAATPQYHP